MDTQKEDDRKSGRGERTSPLDASAKTPCHPPPSFSTLERHRSATRRTAPTEIFSRPDAPASEVLRRDASPSPPPLLSASSSAPSAPAVVFRVTDTTGSSMSMARTDPPTPIPSRMKKSASPLIFPLSPPHPRTDEGSARGVVRTPLARLAGGLSSPVDACASPLQASEPNWSSSSFSSSETSFTHEGHHAHRHRHPSHARRLSLPSCTSISERFGFVTAVRPEDFQQRSTEAMAAERPPSHGEAKGGWVRPTSSSGQRQRITLLSSPPSHAVVVSPHCPIVTFTPSLASGSRAPSTAAAEEKNDGAGGRTSPKPVVGETSCVDDAEGSPSRTTVSTSPTPMTTPSRDSHALETDVHRPPVFLSVPLLEAESLLMHRAGGRSSSTPHREAEDGVGSAVSREGRHHQPLPASASASSVALLPSRTSAFASCKALTEAKGSEVGWSEKSAGWRDETDAWDFPGRPCPEEEETPSVGQSSAGEPSEAHSDDSPLLSVLPPLSAICPTAAQHPPPPASLWQSEVSLESGSAPTSWISSTENGGRWVRETMVFLDSEKKRRKSMDRPDEVEREPISPPPLSSTSRWCAAVSTPAEPLAGRNERQQEAEKEAPHVVPSDAHVTAPPPPLSQSASAIEKTPRHLTPTATDPPPALAEASSSLCTVGPPPLGLSPSSTTANSSCGGDGVPPPPLPLPLPPEAVWHSPVEDPAGEGWRPSLMSPAVSDCVTAVGGHHLVLKCGRCFLKESSMRREERFYEAIRAFQERLVQIASTMSTTALTAYNHYAGWEAEDESHRTSPVTAPPLEEGEKKEDSKHVRRPVVRTTTTEKTNRMLPLRPGGESTNERPLRPLPPTSEYADLIRASASSSAARQPTRTTFLSPSSPHAPPSPSLPSPMRSTAAADAGADADDASPPSSSLEQFFNLHKGEEHWWKLSDKATFHSFQASYAIQKGETRSHSGALLSYLSSGVPKRTVVSPSSRGGMDESTSDAGENAAGAIDDRHLWWSSSSLPQEGGEGPSSPAVAPPSFTLIPVLEGTWKANPEEARSEAKEEEEEKGEKEGEATREGRAQEAKTISCLDQSMEDMVAGQTAHDEDNGGEEEGTAAARNESARAAALQLLASFVPLYRGKAMVTTEEDPVRHSPLHRFPSSSLSKEGQPWMADPSTPPLPSSPTSSPHREGHDDTKDEVERRDTGMEKDDALAERDDTVVNTPVPCSTEKTDPHSMHSSTLSTSFKPKYSILSLEEWKPTRSPSVPFPTLHTASPSQIQESSFASPEVEKGKEKEEVARQEAMEKNDSEVLGSTTQQGNRRDRSRSGSDDGVSSKGRAEGKGKENGREEGGEAERTATHEESCVASPSIFSSLSPSSSVEVIVLEDVCHEFLYPCVLDMKMGRRQYGLCASEKKKKSKTTKAKMSTSGEYGIRLAGYRKFDMETTSYHSRGKVECRYFNLEKLHDELSYFLNYNRTLALQFRQQLERLRAAFSLQRVYRFFTSSLLFVYDAAQPVVTARVVMVDFAFTYERWELQAKNDEDAEFEYDIGYIKALDSLLSLLE